MVNKKLSKKIIDIEESDLSEQEIEDIQEVKRKPKKEIVNEIESDDEIEKPKKGKEKKPYVQTEARKLAFQKALENRKKY